MTYYRVYSAARREEVALSGTYAGASAFLIGANPKLLGLDLRLLNMPGIVTMAINNAAILIEPTMFIHLDGAQCFNYNIFTNPKIIKFGHTGGANDIVEGQKVCKYPNSFFFDTDDKITSDNFCSYDGKIVGWRNTFFAALQVLYQLGFTKIYMIGCVFDIKEENPYAYDHDIGEENTKRNRTLYNKAVDILKELTPKLRDERVSLYTCHDKTSLDGVIPYVSFEEAIGNVTRDGGSIFHNQIIHCNDE